MQCDYFSAGICRSCAHMGVPYGDQLTRKDAAIREALAGFPTIEWESPVASNESGFRNKAKLAVGGTTENPTLGITDRQGRGIDLSECGLYLPGIHAAIPHLSRFITDADLIPYDVANRRGELKYFLLTESPDGEFLLRIVLRSTAQLTDVEEHLPALRAAIPGLAVVSVNLLPEHKAVIEGPEEIVLTERSTVPFRLNGITLHLGPRAFFQTNTQIAAALYRQAAAWLDGEQGSIADLYCGVGGFALHLATPNRDVRGVEVSEDAIRAARESARELLASQPVAPASHPSVPSTHPDDPATEPNLPTTNPGTLGTIEFVVGDATEYASEADAVVVNPPRRGIGSLADWLEQSSVSTVLYSSCNVHSLAKDLGRMPSFTPVRGRVFDMFPQTHHAEVMVLLRRR